MEEASEFEGNRIQTCMLRYDIKDLGKVILLV